MLWIIVDDTTTRLKAFFNALLDERPEDKVIQLLVDRNSDPNNNLGWATLSEDARRHASSLEQLESIITELVAALDGDYCLLMDVLLVGVHDEDDPSHSPLAELVTGILQQHQGFLVWTSNLRNGQAYSEWVEKHTNRIGATAHELAGDTAEQAKRAVRRALQLVSDDHPMKKWLDVCQSTSPEGGVWLDAHIDQDLHKLTQGFATLLRCQESQLEDLFELSVSDFAAKRKEAMKEIFKNLCLQPARRPTPLTYWLLSLAAVRNKDRDSPLCPASFHVIGKVSHLSTHAVGVEMTRESRLAHDRLVFDLASSIKERDDVLSPSHFFLSEDRFAIKLRTHLGTSAPGSVHAGGLSGGLARLAAHAREGRDWRNADAGNVGKHLFSLALRLTIGDNKSGSRFSIGIPPNERPHPLSLRVFGDHDHALAGTDITFIEIG